MDLHRRDAYVLAVAPAMMFLGVYAYERGRYYFLRIAPDFIDLSVNRLLAGGAVIGALALTLVGLTLWVWRHSATKGWDAKYLAALLAMSVFLALPIGLWLQEIPQFPAGKLEGTNLQRFLSMLAGGIAGVVTSFLINVVRRKVERQRAAAKEIEEAIRQYAEANALDLGRRGLNASEYQEALAHESNARLRVPSWGSRLALLVPWRPLGSVALVVWIAIVFAGLGYRVERSSVSRLCVSDHFVADVHGDNLILKKYDPKSGDILSPIKVVEIHGVDLDSCRPRLVGAKGFVLWD